MKKFMNKKVITIISAILLIIIFWLIGSIIIKSLKNKDGNVVSENTQLKEEKEERPVKSKSYLYKAYSYDYDGRSTFYAAYIDAFYNLYTVYYSEFNNEYLKADESGVWTLNDDDYAKDVIKKLDEMEANELYLTDIQKEYLKQIIDGIEFQSASINIKNYDTLYVIKESENKSYSIPNNLLYTDLINFSLAIKNHDATRFNVERNENTKSSYTITDTNITELNKGSEIVLDLYSKVTYSRIVLSNYIENKLTNDTIITLTLQLMEKNKEYGNCTSEELYSSCKFNKHMFDSYAKKIFGPGVKYDITTYAGARDGCGSYYYDNGELYTDYGSGCGFEEQVFGAIDYAYQTSEKLVIIEKSLYSTYGECMASNPCYGEKLGLSAGVYNSITDKKLITEDADIYADELLNKYGDYGTYYAYTFSKASDGNYYYTSFDKIS